MGLTGRRTAALVSVAVLIAAVVVVCGWAAGAFSSQMPRAKLVPPPVPLTDADCSGGHVVFTFDGGPLKPPLGGTPLVLSTLEALHVRAVFFALGTAADKNP